MLIDFKTEDGYDYAKTRFVEMSALDGERGEGAAAYERIRRQINIRADIRIFDAAINGAEIILGNEAIECPMLNGANGRIYAFAITVGELQLSCEMLDRTLEDMWGTAFVDSGLELLRNKIIADNPDKYVSHPFGPGFYGIPLDAVKKIFSVLDCAGAGIALKNGVLEPMKSGIGFFLVSDSEPYLSRSDCENCMGSRSCEYCRNNTSRTIKITFKNENKTVDVPVGITVTDAAGIAGIAMETPCGGLGKCGKCEGIVENNGSAEIARLCTKRAYEDITVYTKSLPGNNEADNMKIRVDVIGCSGVDNFALAIDIGTTTIEAVLTAGPEPVVRASAVNPQALYAADVIERVRIASKSGALHKLIIREINFIIDRLCAAINTDGSGIINCVITGNTVMQCIAAGINPHTIGYYPYTVPDKFGRYIPADDLGLNLRCAVYFPPVISSFVGGDISCGIAYTRLWNRDKTLFIDIGTNGEMAYVKNNKIYAASAAAGPAFEEMGIRFGMRAQSGAVSGFKITDGGIIAVETIDGAPAVGICGSGLLEIIAELVKHGIITANGTLCDKRLIETPIKKHLCTYNGEYAFKICSGIYLTQSDIRQVQLAKGAIRAGIEILAPDAEYIIITGAFGTHAIEGSLTDCGILPRGFQGKIKFIDNTALVGAVLLLDDTPLRKKIYEITSEAKAVPLSENANFGQLFMEHMLF